MKTGRWRHAYILAITLAMALVCSFSNSDALAQSQTGPPKATRDTLKVTVKVRWLKREFVTYTFRKGDSVRLVIEPTSGPASSGSGLGGLSSLAGKSLPKAPKQLGNELKQAQGLEKKAKGLGAGNLSPAELEGKSVAQFSFVRQGGGPLYQGVKVAKFDRRFYIPENGNYTMIFKNTGLFSKYFAVKVIRVSPPRGKRLSARDTIHYDTLSNVILEKEITLYPTRDLTAKSSYIIPVTYDDDPSLLGLSYVVTVNENLIDSLKMMRGKAGAFSLREPSEGFFFDYSSIPILPPDKSEFYFNVLLDGVESVPLSHINYVGALSSYGLGDKPMGLLVENKSKVRTRKVYVKVVQYYLQRKRKP